MTPLPARLADLFHASWPGLLVYQDHRGEVERVELVAGGEVLDTYTPAELTAGHTLGLYEQLHAQAIRNGLRVTLDSDPERHPDHRHTVTLSRGRTELAGEGPDPLTAFLRAAMSWQEAHRQRPGLRERLRWAWQDARQDRRERRAV